MTRRVAQWLKRKWRRPPTEVLDQAYQVTFSTPQGQLVLQHLLNEVYCQVCLSSDPIVLATHNARRSVVHEMLENIERAEVGPTESLIEEVVNATY